MVQRGLAHKSSLGATLTRSRAAAASFGAALARVCVFTPASEYVIKRAAARCMCEREGVRVREREYQCESNTQTLSAGARHYQSLVCGQQNYGDAGPFIIIIAIILSTKFVKEVSSK